MKSTKRIWELQSSTVCKVVGMALLLKDLQKIARKFGISNNDPLIEEEFALHTTVVQMCNRDNRVARHTEKLIEKRFLIHERNVPLEEPIETIKKVRENPQDLQVPLWAILWGLATRGRLADAQIETSLFGFIHMMEHRLLRDHWKSLHSEGTGDDHPVDPSDEVLYLKRNLLDMEWANRKLEKLIVSLRNQLDTSEATRSHPSVAVVEDNCTAKRCQSTNNGKLDHLRVLLAQAKYCNCELETENAQLKEEIAGLIGELNRHQRILDNEQLPVSPAVCPFASNLGGKRITLVGGIESLESHYREIIESAGGQFRRHNGVCSTGDRALEDCILGSDLVVCPVEVNSHNAAKSVKKICKATGVRCCFPRSASITGLRRALEEHYSDQRVA